MTTARRTGPLDRWEAHDLDNEWFMSSWNITDAAHRSLGQITAAPFGRTTPTGRDYIVVADWIASRLPPKRPGEHRDLSVARRWEARLRGAVRGRHAVRPNRRANGGGVRVRVAMEGERAFNTSLATFARQEGVEDAVAWASKASGGASRWFGGGAGVAYQVTVIPHSSASVRARGRKPRNNPRDAYPGERALPGGGWVRVFTEYATMQRLASAVGRTTRGDAFVVRRGSRSGKAGPYTGAKAPIIQMDFDAAEVQALRAKGLLRPSAHGGTGYAWAHHESEGERWQRERSAPEIAEIERAYQWGMLTAAERDGWLKHVAQGGTFPRWSVSHTRPNGRKRRAPRTTSRRRTRR